MLSVLPTLLAATGAALAAAAWAAEARRPHLVRSRDGAALAGWGALSCAGHLALVGAPAPQAWQTALAAVALLVAAAIATVGVVGAVGGLLPAGAAGPAIAEGVLIGSSVVCAAWVGLSAPVAATPGRVLVLLLALVPAALLAVVLRLPVSAAGGPLVGPQRRRLQVTALALAAFVVSALVLAARQRPDVVAVLVAAVGYGAAALVPYVGAVEPREHRRPTYVALLLPYALVTVAVLAVGLQVARDAAGALTGLLVIVVAASLVAVQAFAMRRGADLLTDLEVSRQRLEALVENAQDVILGLDVGGRVVAANAAVQRLLARAPENLHGRDVAEVAVLDDRPRVREAVFDVVQGRCPTAKVELRIAAPGEGTAEMRLRGVEGGAVAVLSDVTEAVELRGRLQVLARHDRMTGLVNRGVVLDTVTSWLASGAAVTVLYCDLDGYKAVNDRFGHLAGDDVLIEVARRLETAVRGITADEALLGRIGGDEFVVALRGVVGAAARAAGERLVAALRPTFLVGDRTVRLGISIGVSGTDDVVPLPGAGGAGDGAPALPGEGGPAAELLHRGDLAMFAAKAAGRAKVARWDPDVSERALRRVDIAIGLRQALDTGRLALAYQPLVRLSDGVVVGVEALVRVEGGWDDGPGALSRLSGFVSPAELVEVAEDTGEITELGRWVLRQATRRASLWRAIGHDLFVAVNMSVRQLSEDGFGPSVRRALSDSGLAADKLVVEITEGQLVGEEDPVRGVIEDLRRDGVQFVIDDFGTGYSSLSYLKTMPVRAIKLDRTLLDGVGTDPRATTLARAVVGVARALGLVVVAEGLESLEAARQLRDLGAWAGQGFALHPPLREDELLGVLAGDPLDLSGGRRVIDLRDGAPAAALGGAEVGGAEAGGAEVGGAEPGGAEAGGGAAGVLGTGPDGGPAAGFPDGPASSVPAVPSAPASPASPVSPAAPSAAAPLTGGIRLAAHGPVGEAPRVAGSGNGVAGVVLPPRADARPAVPRVSDDETRGGAD